MDNHLNEDESRKRELLKLMNSLTNFKMMEDFDSLESIEAKYGIPTKVEKYTEDGFEFEKKTWETEMGTVEMLIIQPQANISLLDKELKTLEYLIKDMDDEAVKVLLVTAVEDEDFPTAIILRDELRSRKK